MNCSSGSALVPHLYEEWSGRIDTTKKVFINVNCYHDSVIAKNAVAAIKKIGFSENKIFKGMDLGLVTDGD